MNFPELLPAKFLERRNRFTAVVYIDSGVLSTAYIPTTGRLTGVLIPGCRVWLAHADKIKGRKTGYDMVLAELESGGYCCVNASMANRLFEESIQLNKLDAFQYKEFSREVSYGRSRLDFRLSNRDEACWVEVKSVSFVKNGVGMFPDAPTSRGQKHLLELAELARAGKRVSAVFIALREDAKIFSPFAQVDPDFTALLSEVQGKGVEIHAYRCKLDRKSIEIDEEIPINL